MMPPRELAPQQNTMPMPELARKGCLFVFEGCYEIFLSIFL